MFGGFDPDELLTTMLLMLDLISVDEENEYRSCQGHLGGVAHGIVSMQRSDGGYDQHLSVTDTVGIIVSSSFYCSLTYWRVKARHLFVSDILFAMVGVS